MANINDLEAALEACRPGSNDLARPEMDALRAQLERDPAWRARYERTQQADGVVARAFHEVPVPAGLEDRLLAALGANDQPRLVVRPAAAENHTTQRLTRRWWLVGGLAAAAAALLLATQNWPQPTATPAELARLAQNWTENLPTDPAGWQPFDERRFPTLAWHSARWRTIDTELDPRAVVFDFPLRGGQRLLVYRLASSRDLGLPALPYQPLTTTGPWRVAAWQESEHVYVVVTNRGELLDRFRPPAAA